MVNAVGAGATASAAAFLLLLHAWVQSRQSSPYMDELLHVPQARELCNAARERRAPRYDGRITTPPGAYLPAAALAALTGVSDPLCDTRVLRLMSVAWTVGCLPLVAALLRALLSRRRRMRQRRRERERGRERELARVQERGWDRKLKTDRDVDEMDTGAEDGTEAQWSDAAVWSVAAALWLNPASVFFAQLFYTDAPATFCLLLTAVLAARGGVAGAANAGICGSVVRQTNMVWHCFCAGEAEIFAQGEERDEEAELAEKDKDASKSVGERARELVTRNAAHLVAGVAYAVFLVSNGGVALGDKVHHAATVHAAMLPYLLGFHGAAYLPLQLATSASTRRALHSMLASQHALALLAGCTAVVAACIASTGAWAHAFVLADNRHAPFYAHRWWLRRSALHRLSLIPAYVWTPATLLGELFNAKRDNGNTAETGKEKEETQTRTQTEALVERAGDALLLACAMAVLLPTPLLEPRYFVAPSLLLAARRASRINPVPAPARVLLMAVLPLMLANIALVYVFAEMPFARPPDPHMPTDTSPGRFML